MPRRLLIIPEYWLPHIFSMIRGFYDLGLDPDEVEVYWTNKKWQKDEFGISQDWEWPAYMPIEIAMKRCRESWFDAVVVTDGTLVGYLLPKQMQRIMLDSADHRYVVSDYLYFADYYLKTQHPIGNILVGNSQDLSAKKPSIPVVPWPYCVSSEIEDSAYTESIFSKPSVHFRGWGWPKKRVDFVKAIHQAGVPFTGGLYARKELVEKAPFPEDLRKERIGFREYLREMKQCQIALNPVGNGQMCFRTFEIFRAGLCCVSDRLDIRWPFPEPRHGVEWFVADSPEDAVQISRALLDNPEKCAEVGANARLFWERYCKPKHGARRLLQLLGWESGN
jgi:hypothetical protein